MTPETVILVRNPDGDLIAALRPTDPLNPQFDCEILERDPDLQTEIVRVTSVRDFNEYGKEE